MTRSQKYAYAAGIIDGEGCIGIYSFGQKKNLYPTVAVVSVDKELPEWLLSLFDRGTIRVRKPKGSSHKNHYYRWEVTGNSALDVLMLIEPYLVIEKKRRKATLLIEEWPRHAEGNGGARVPNDPEVMRTRHTIKELFNRTEQIPA